MMPTDLVWQPAVCCSSAERHTAPEFHGSPQQAFLLISVSVSQRGSWWAWLGLASHGSWAGFRSPVLESLVTCRHGSLMTEGQRKPQEDLHVSAYTWKTSHPFPWAKQVMCQNPRSAGWTSISGSQGPTDFYKTKCLPLLSPHPSPLRCLPSPLADRPSSLLRLS